MPSQWTPFLALALVMCCRIRPVGAFWITKSTHLPWTDSGGFVKYHEARHRIERCDMILKEGKRDGSPDGDTDDAGSNEEKSIKRLTAVRVGGRSVKQQMRTPMKRASQANEYQRYFLPSLIGLLLVLSLGGTGSNTYYYSYSSYSFETSSYNKNGVLEVKREESANFRSNIPGLRNNPSMISDLRQENQRLDQQEQEYLDAFSSGMIRAVEELLDESWE